MSDENIDKSLQRLKELEQYLAYKMDEPLERMFILRKIQPAITALERQRVPRGGMSDKVIEQLKSLRNYTAECLSEPYSDDDVMALDKAIAALERQRKGWKLVPVEPTQQMRHAGRPGFATSDPQEHARAIWRAMLAAAPEPDDS